MKADNLRVCHVASGDLLAGAEILLLNLSKALTEKLLNHTIFVLLNKGILANKLFEQGANVIILQEKGFPADVLIIFKLTRLFREQAVDVVHTHGYKCNVIGGIASWISKSSLLIRTEHGKPPTIFNNGISKSTFFSLLDYFMGKYVTDQTVSVSSELTSILRRRYPQEKITTIYNGIDFSQFAENFKLTDLKAEFGIEDKNKLIGIFARLNHEKGIDLFLRTAKLVSLEAPHIRFFIVGEGPLYKELRNETIRLNIEKQVIFTGFRTDVYGILCQMDVVVLSSRHEGMPMIILEAMALRRPIVATKVGGLPEVIQDRKTGILVPSGDEFALAKACLELIENPVMAEQLGLNAHEDVKKRFSAQVMLDKLLTLYRESFQKKRKSTVGIVP